MKITRTLPTFMAIAAIGLAAAACGALDRGQASGSDEGVPPQSDQANTTYAAGGTTGAPLTSAATAGSGTASRSVAESAKNQSAPGSAYDASGTGGGTTALPDASAEFARKVILTATMNLNVKDVQAAFSEANRLARSAGGYVEKSSFSNPGGSKDERNVKATVTLRVPAGQYDATLASLRSIEGAKVQSEGSKSSEVTEQYTDLQSRLRNLERTEGQYLKLLEQAKSITEILQMNDRLDNVRLQIEQIQGRLKVLDQLSEMTTIDLTLAPFPAIAKVDDGKRSLGEAFVDAWEASLEAVEQVAAAGIYAAVAALWLAIPVGLVFFAGRRMFRRDHGVTPAA